MSTARTRGSSNAGAARPRRGRRVGHHRARVRRGSRFHAEPVRHRSPTRSARGGGGARLSRRGPEAARRRRAR
jgi:hypothetical protein